MASRRRRRGKASLSRPAARGPATQATPKPAADSPPKGSPATGRLSGLDDATLADVATRLWRSRRQLNKMGEPSRLLAHEVNGALDAFNRAGLVVQDHEGLGFDPGLALVAVAYEPTPGAVRERVLETLRPSVYLHGRHIQRGEVVVAVPDPPQAPPGPPDEREETAS